jgi:hypothetical protein
LARGWRDRYAATRGATSTLVGAALRRQGRTRVTVAIGYSSVSTLWTV